MVSATEQPRNGYVLAICRTEDKRMIGVGRLATEPQRAATIGFALDPAVWGRGYGLETVRALLRLGFDELAFTVSGRLVPPSTRRPPACWRRPG
ncbi:GNAT family N-acetyltransferase [Streptomyces durbertensis]|uniref:GNAT family N-acetyltransferase n=1 Tax=Streptomyces durbertensis TaxID=2448886 RepID=UPI002B1FD2A0|nr:GNAT family N-acetyltransferase [Streptomyces durbertensis]